jgi:iron-sulfur cluster insertion protein
MNISLTEAAAKRILFLAEKEKRPHLMLRIIIDGGGCSGFQYKFSLADEAMAEDISIAYQGRPLLLVDPISADLMKDSEVHYSEEMIGAMFVVRNPQAKSSCGCGTSFSTM